MFKKLLILALFAIVCLSIKQRSEAHLQENHEFFGLFKPDNPKNRTEK